MIRSSLLVPERIGFTRAAEMAMLGERIGARQAVEWGLANRAVAERSGVHFHVLAGHCARASYMMRARSRRPSPSPDESRPVRQRRGAVVTPTSG